MQRSGNYQNTSPQLKPDAIDCNADNLPPKFSLQYLVKHSHFGFESLAKEHKSALADTIYQLSQYKWSDLRYAARHGKGYEKIKRSTLKFKLPDGITDECSIIAFRFFGKAPMIGYRGSDTFYIIAFDTKFKAYAH